MRSAFLISIIVALFFALFVAFSKDTNLEAQSASPQFDIPATKSIEATPAVLREQVPVSTLQKIRDSKTLNVGYRTDAVPFSSLDANKQPIGYSVDICHDLMSRLSKSLNVPGLQINYIPAPISKRFDMLRNGDIDIECGNSINNPERRKTFSFALSILFSGPRILTSVDSGIKNFVDLRGKRVAVMRGSNAVPMLQQRINDGRMGGSQLVEVESNVQAIQLMQQGKVDGIVTGETSLYGMRSTMQDPERYVVTGDYLIMEGVAFMLRKGDDEFLRAVNRQLEIIMADGNVERSYQKWFQSPIPPSGKALNLPMNPLLRDQLRWPTDKTGVDFN